MLRVLSDTGLYQPHSSGSYCVIVALPLHDKPPLAMAHPLPLDNELKSRKTTESLNCATPCFKVVAKLQCLNSRAGKLHLRLMANSCLKCGAGLSFRAENRHILLSCVSVKSISIKLAYVMGC